MYLWRWYRVGNGNRSNKGDVSEGGNIGMRCSVCFKTEEDCGGKKHLLCCICMNALYCSR